MIIYLYNDRLNKIERYILELYDPMPYTTHGSLSVKDFRADSKSSILWTTVTAMLTWNRLFHAFTNPHPPLHAFKRICEGGHPPQSQHYSGTAFDFPFPTSAFPHISASNSSYGYPPLHLGDTGVYVLVLQDALFTLGISPCALDGFFGSLTKEALCNFQQSFFIPVTGYADELTWRKLTFHASGIGNINKIPYLA